MTPIEALMQIVRTVDRDPDAHVNGLAQIARNGLRHSGSHRILSRERKTTGVFMVCCCGWSTLLLDFDLDDLPNLGGHLEDMAGMP